MIIAFRSFWIWCSRQMESKFQRTYLKQNVGRWNILVCSSLPLMMLGKHQKLSGNEFTRYSYRNLQPNIPDILGYSRAQCIPLVNYCVLIVTEYLPYQQKFWQSWRVIRPLETLLDPAKRTAIVGRAVQQAALPIGLIREFMRWLNHALAQLSPSSGAGTQGFLFTRTQNKQGRQQIPEQD